jgi:hypothetical protein
MTEPTLTTLTPDELIERAHAAAVDADAEKERANQAFQAEQARKEAHQRQEQADQLRTLIRKVCGFDIDLAPADLDEYGAWPVHPQVRLCVERWIGHPTPVLKLVARRPGTGQEVVTSLADLSRIIQAAEAYGAKLAAEREAKRLQREEAARIEAERTAQRTGLEQQRAALVDQEPHAPEPQFFVSAAECSDGLLLVPAGPILDVYPLRFTSAHPLYLLSLHQNTVERLLKTLEETATPAIITAGLQTILVMDTDLQDDSSLAITWIKETDDGDSRAGWVVHQQWGFEDFTDGLRAWLDFRRAVLDWEAQLRLIDDKLRALYSADF